MTMPTGEEDQDLMRDDKAENDEMLMPTANPALTGKKSLICIHMPPRCGGEGDAMGRFTWGIPCRQDGLHASDSNSP